MSREDQYHFGESLINVEKDLIELEIFHLGYNSKEAICAVQEPLLFGPPPKIAVYR